MMNRKKSISEERQTERKRKRVHPFDTRIAPTPNKRSHRNKLEHKLTYDQRELDLNT